MAFGYSYITFESTSKIFPFDKRHGKCAAMEEVCSINYARPHSKLRQVNIKHHPTSKQGTQGSTFLQEGGMK